ncbi:hypothetical protein KSC_014630 [Ktedonobacter sp. SOSP1-52]|uniref:hypothetical protein n=1 Tax=Ktedonobacter sp. SOSP1-52 TaxID=2778366 RepID=UPI0019162A34|nr:hypothetical protein [Ktedonobacter sp. SOSP1-52]GHO62571.1 hypothetical protein KSC_014630 [Ktedonobacter sp. SOSP1-52]
MTAAKEVMNLIDLVGNAHKEPGRSEVLRIIPQLPSEEGTQILQELLRRGDQDPQRCAPLHLLACACLQFVSLPSTALQTACAERLQRLIPPHSIKEARDLAQAGSLAIQPLMDFLLDDSRPPFSPTEIPSWQSEILCLRTLILIGGEEALDALADVVRHGVHASSFLELQDGWRYFDQEAYARRVILPLQQQSSMALYKKPMAFFKTLTGFEHFTHLKELRLYDCFKLKDITALAQCAA